MARKLHLLDNKNNLQCTRTRKYQSMSLGGVKLDEFNKWETGVKCKDCLSVADRWNAKRADAATMKESE